VLWQNNSIDVSFFIYLSETISCNHKFISEQVVDGQFFERLVKL
jgi:hypothetical protein